MMMPPPLPLPPHVQFTHEPSYLSDMLKWLCVRHRPALACIWLPCRVVSSRVVLRRGDVTGLSMATPTCCLSAVAATPACSGAYHGVELDFLFATFDMQEEASVQPDERVLGMEMMRLWTEFATAKRKVRRAGV